MGNEKIARHRFCFGDFKFENVTCKDLSTHTSLCCMISLHAVRPILEVDVQLLENEFKDGYRNGDMVFYVSLVDKDGSHATLPLILFKTGNCIGVIKMMHMNHCFPLIQILSN